MKITPHSLVASLSVPPSLKEASTEKVKTPAVSSSEPTGPVSQARQALHEMPETDSQRVAELKAALRDGTLDLDAESLSRSMMDYYRQ